MAPKPVTKTVTLSAPKLTRIKQWLVGDTPLIVHAWSHKAKEQMLNAQLKVVKAEKREARDPHQDFLDSLYYIDENTFGFPAMAFKKALVSVAHKDKGLAKVDVMAALYVHALMCRQKPAFAGAVCDMPLFRLYGTEPEMREDNVNLGGISRVASLAYRGQFRHWAVKFDVTINDAKLKPEHVAFLIQEAGMSCGVGEWRNEKSGFFGAFRMATAEEAELLDKHAAGEIDFPLTDAPMMAAAE